MAHAYLGHKNEAIHDAKKACELLPLSLDAYTGVIPQIYLLRIYTITGEHDDALDLMEYLFSLPSGTHVNEFRLDPDWDPLRSNPRFQKILEKK